METLSHEQFLDKYLRTAKDLDNLYGPQCIDLARLYSKEVLNIPLGSFGGTARSGWFNTKKTFDPKIWDKIEWRPGIVPKRGDIIFYDTGVSGHVAVVHDANKLDITVIEQNGATGNGLGKGYDQINLSTTNDYKNVYGWMRKKVSSNNVTLL